MAIVNQEAKEIHCKIVYCGPSLGGKTTNLQWVYHNTTRGSDASEIMRFYSNPERTEFYDFLPVMAGQIRGLETRLHLYTVPGQVIYEQLRRLLLKGVDGIIFVADSQIDRMDENIEAIKNLEKYLEQQGGSLKDLPLVIQYNKRDLKNAASVAELRTALNKYNAPDFEANAAKGDGVLESLRTVTKGIITLLKGGSIN